MFKKVLISMLIAVCTCGCLMAQSTRDVVYLKNGGVVKGTIIEQVPNQSLKIETSDGSVFVYQMSDIEKIGKEQMTSPIPNNSKNNNNGSSVVGYKNPTTAWALSFLIPGGGQFYNGETGKGIVFLGGYAASAAIFWYVSWPIGLTGMLVTSVWSQIDAPTTANRLNRMNSLSFALSDGMTLEMGSTIINNADYGMPGGLSSGFSVSLSF